LAQNNQPIKGFRFSAIAAGVKKAGTERLDLALVTSDIPAQAAGVTTMNLVCAAPVEIVRERLHSGVCQAVLMNSGNANAYTGVQGKSDAYELTELTAKKLGIVPELIVPMSTGVIGNPLPMARLRSKIPTLVEQLGSSSYLDVAHAIMTTDTKPKTVILDGETSTAPFRILGMAKGAGMIAPDMATLLSVVLTDIKVRPSLLKEFLVEAAAETFNRVTIDGDTSTNDTLLVLSGGHQDAIELGQNGSDEESFFKVLKAACKDLSRQIVRDGEGVTKVVEIHVIGTENEADALKVARKIAESPLVKTAFHGEDPNWGRIISSAGRAGVVFHPDNLDLSIGGIPIVLNGTLVSDDWETAAHAAMKKPEFTVELDLKMGTSSTTVLTTDFSEEYVSINADYRS
jgi:glutamate N-acetyltransferase/amino-acid N-acetyltransferase